MWSWYVYYNCTLKCLVISSGTEKPAPAWLHLHQGPLRQHLGPQGSEVTAKAIETGSGRIQHKDCPASAESDLRTDFYHPNANDGYQGINILFTPQMPMTDIKVWTYFLPPKCQWQISRYEHTFYPTNANDRYQGMNRLLPPKCQRRISRYKHTFYPTNANDGYQGMNILFTTQMPMTDIKVWTYFLPHKCQWQISRYEQTFTTQMPMTEISRLMQMFTFKNIWQFTTMKMCSDAIFCQTSCKI